MRVPAASFEDAPSRPMVAPSLGLYSLGLSRLGARSETR